MEAVSDEPTYSPGLEGVVAGETAVSTIADGLRYRGYSIEEIADSASFEEVAFLLLSGELPTGDQLTGFQETLSENAKLPADLFAALRTIPVSASMMDVMRTGASLLAHWDTEADSDSPDAAYRISERLLARLPVLMAAAYRIRNGLMPVSYDPSLSFAANVLWMLTEQPPADEAVRAMDISLSLYAEHEYNASTFTARVVTSTLSDVYSAVCSAVAALKGPLHGGANERVMAVLREVGSPAKAESWVRAAIENKQKIMGFGHRVYKTGDPRAKYLKKFCVKLAKSAEHQLLEEVAEVIETIVGSEKGIPPNLDWPSARLYYYLGLAVELYTPLFVCSRVTGWCAHVMEQRKGNRIIRPRSRYVGEGARAFVPLAER